MMPGASGSMLRIPSNVMGQGGNYIPLFITTTIYIAFNNNLLLY